ncbi:MAG: hypothetical protein OXF99_01960 [bacterium]|nr:hypothetical protein [bacterium]
MGEVGGVSDLFDAIWWPHLRTIAANLLFWGLFLVLFTRHVLWPLFSALTGAINGRDRILFSPNQTWARRWIDLKFHFLHFVLKSEGQRNRELTSRLHQSDQTQERPRDMQQFSEPSPTPTDQSDDVGEST